MKRLRQLVLGLGSVLLTCGVAQGQAKLGPYIVDSNGLKVGQRQEPATCPVFIERRAVDNPWWAKRFQSRRHTLLYFTDGPAAAPTVYTAWGSMTLCTRPVGRQRTASSALLSQQSAVDAMLSTAEAMNLTARSARAAPPRSLYCRPGTLTASASAFTPPFLGRRCAAGQPSAGSGHLQRRADESPVLPVDRGAVRLGHNGRLQRGTAAVLPGQFRYARPDGGVSGEGARALEGEAEEPSSCADSLVNEALLPV